MESSHILNRMASYDFKAPIDIVCFEEENSNDKIDLTSSPDSNEQEITLNKEIKNRLQIRETSHEKQVNITPKNKKRKQKTDCGKTKENQKRQKVSETTINRKDKCDITAEYINDELKTLAKYLTLIMESYNHYLSVLNNRKSSIYDVTLSKKSFLTTKHYFFNAAYNYVMSHIMPNATNQSFTQIFLNYISNMASERIKRDCYIGIREMYFEMIEWAKSKSIKNLNDTNHAPMLKKYLNDPPIISTAKSLGTSTNIQLPPSINADQTKLCIFSAGPVGNQVSINIDKSLLSNKNQLLNKQPSKNIIALDQNQFIRQHNKFPVNGNFAFDNMNFPHNGNIDRYIYRESESRIPQCQPPQNQNSQGNVLNENSVYNKSYFNYYHSMNNNQSNNCASNMVIHRTAQMHRNKAMFQDGTIQTVTRQHLDPVMRGPPPPYYLPINQMAHMTPDPLVQTDFSNVADLTRSSVSTDSGFISPVGSKNSSNTIEDIMKELLELENIVQPAKSTDASGTCHVCHKKSSLMCSACYKTIYCSTKCQSADWEAHRIICRQ